MISIDKLKLFRPTNGLIIPTSGIDKKNVCLYCMPENHLFLDSFNSFNIKTSQVRNVFVPTTMKPKTLLTSTYKQELTDHKLKPYRGLIGDYSKLEGKNFYYDLSKYLEAIVSRFKFTKFNTGRAYDFISGIIQILTGISSDSFIKVLLYSVDLNKPISSKLFSRRFFPIYDLLTEYKAGKITTLPFDKIILFFYDHTGSRFVLLYDNRFDLNLPRIRNLVLHITDTNDKESLNKNIETVADKVVETHEITKDESESKKSKIKSAIKNFLKKEPSALSVTNNIIQNNDKSDSTKLLTTSIIYNNVGDIDKSKKLSNSIKNDPTTIRKIVNDKSQYLLPIREVDSVATNEFVRYARPEALVDHEIPVHILDKRKNDFKEQMVDDMVRIFEPFKNEDIPLKVKSISVKAIKDPVGELKKTIKDRYSIELTDSEGKTHNVQIELPHLTDDGTFLVNGQPRILVNQIVTYPIFFNKQYQGKLETVYSTLTIHSKKLAKTSYFLVYVAGYKIPLMMLLGYKVGFEETMKLFNITYSISNEKTVNSFKVGEQYITLNSEDEVGVELIQSFIKCINLFPKSGDVLSKEFWMKTLINEIGTKNCIYSIDQAWQYILTPVEVKILQTKGDPTNLRDIIKYICSEIIRGRVDDRNAVDKQRIRTAEIFTHLIQKQAISAYNEFLAKKLGGDDTARLRIDSNAAFSKVINSQNVQLLETINPMEELSMMTRITPVGIGGIDNIEAFPRQALNIHYTYYGNIDPLETPDGPGVGTQQHLTVGSAITNVRGLFNIKDRNMVKPSEILSVGPAMVPFVESNEGCRVTMGVGQTKQAIPLVNAEPPATSSGYESILTPLLSDNFIKKSPVNGIVYSIEDNIIQIKETISDKIIPVDVSSKVIRSGQGKHGLSVFKNIVTVGQKVKKDEIIAEGANVFGGMISNGINLLTAFMPWKGYNFEDGVVISESAAKKFTSYHVESESYTLKDDEDVVNVAQIGDSLIKGDILLTHTNALYDVESFKHLRTDGGIVSEIEIYCNLEEEKMPKVLLPIYERFKRKFTILNGSYPVGTFKEKGEKIEGIMVRFTIEQRLILRKGDKLNNRHGNKGVIAIIEKEENMPITPWGEKIEIVLNPLGVINRMNNGQVLELHTGLISKKLAEVMVSQSRTSFISIFQRVLTLLDGTDNHEYSKNLIGYLKTLSDPAYLKLVEKIRALRFITLIFPPFKSPRRENILDALTILGLKPRVPLELPEFNVKTDPVAVGITYVQKLEHLAEKKIQSRGVGGYQGKSLAPTAGKSRGGGGKMGEYDLYSLLSYDATHVIDEFFGPLSSDHATKNQMISDVLQTGKTAFRQALTNPVKDMLNQFMAALMLESE